MTGDRSGPIEFGGVGLHERLATASPHLTASVLARLVAEVPVYGRLPAEELDGDVRVIIEQSVRTFVGVLRAGRLPDVDVLGELRESAAKRAEEGLPIDAVIGAYHIGAQACMDFVAPAAGPDDVAAVFAAHRLLFGYLRLITAAVSAGYLNERQILLGEEHAARQSLLSALLEGKAEGESGLRVSSSYLVLDLSIGTHADGKRDGVDRAVVARRTLRRLRSELDRHCRESVLSMLSNEGGLVLIPYHVTVSNLSIVDWNWVRAVVAAVMKASGADVVAAVVGTDPRGVPAAARLAGELRHVAVSQHKAPGVYRLPDLLLEYQITRAGPARDHLAALLDPVVAKPDLLPTLRAFLANGLDRRHTAARLQVHPNTVDYRLRKLAALTGLDLAQHDDRVRIQAALFARDACSR
ncbi:MAG: helix-turn-helix domain-containing protein [Actinomycetota bacterium]|nr:helix-turn-helix domain-containing protein [Actinomycetota bacterium]